MPSQFENLFAASALPDLYATFGVAGSLYQAPDPVSAQATCTPRIQRHDAMQFDGQGKGVSGEIQTATILVQQTDITKPVTGGEFTITGATGPEVWKIEVTPKLQNGEHHCVCKRIGVSRMMSNRRNQ